MALDYEQIRLSYKSDTVKVLLVGESRPVSGDFFYTVDSLTNYTQRAFAGVFEEARLLRGTAFLEFFKSRGFYFEDLSEAPVNSMSRPEKVALCSAGVPLLAEKIALWRPKAVVAMLVRIDGFVRDAVMRSGVKPEYRAVHYGGFGSQNKYILEIAEFLRELRGRGVI